MPIFIDIEQRDVHRATHLISGVMHAALQQVHGPLDDRLHRIESCALEVFQRRSLTGNLAQAFEV
jgi:hypothetical protein